MQNISELLERQCDNMRRLLKTLEEEHAALAGNVLPAIEATTAAKQTCLMEIERGFERQSSLLTQAGLALSDGGMITYLRRFDQDGRLQLEAGWRRVKELLGRCREQNLLNGRILTVNQRQIQRALTILRGGGPAPENCYGPRGHQANNTMASRSLGKV